MPFLSDRSVQWLKEELSLLTNAVIVPIGDMVSEVLTRVGLEMAISNDRILAGMPHASGANNGRVSRFLGAATEDDKWRRRFLGIAAKVGSLECQLRRPVPSQVYGVVIVLIVVGRGPPDLRASEMGYRAAGPVSPRPSHATLRPRYSSIGVKSRLSCNSVWRCSMQKVPMMISAVLRIVTPNSRSLR